MKKLFFLFLVVFSATILAQNWEVQTTGLSTGAHIRCIIPLDQTQLWASSYSGVIIKTTNAGTTWTSTTVPPKAGYPAYTMDAQTINTAWVSLVDGTNELDWRMAKTTDGGATWTEQLINANSFGDLVYFFDLNEGVILGDPPTDDINNWVVKRTTDAGNTWTSIPPANIPAADGANGEYGSSNSHAVIGDVIWFASYGASSLPAAKVYKSTNRGLNWVVYPMTGLAGNSSAYVAFKDLNNGVAVNTLGKASKTTDGGATWSTPITVDAGGFRALTYVGANTYVAGGGASATGIFYVTRDGGANWTKIDLPTGFTRVHNIKFVNNQLGWIGGRDGKMAKWIGGDITGGAAKPTVEFKINMKIQIKKQEFHVGVDPLFVRGGFNGWGQNDTLKDPDGDSVYSKVVTLDSLGTYEFKFMYRKVAAALDKWEGDPNRSATFTQPASIYNGGYFDKDSIYVSRDSIYTYFSVNMELERLSGRFNPATDSVSVNGSFQGWSALKNLLMPSTLNPDIYEGTFALFAGVGEEIEFKFFYKHGSQDVWESVANRKYMFTQTDFDTKTAVIQGAFNNGSLETVINQPCAIKFTVNMNGAVNFLTGQPFTTVTTVHIAGSSTPLQWPSTGWPNSDSTKVIQLFDDGTHGDVLAGDLIFTNILTFPRYTVLETKYKYAGNWGLSSNGGGNDNESGFGGDHTLRMTKDMVSATAVDTFGKASVTSLRDIVTGIEEEQLRPTVYELSQNYPNPFNPSTVINYTIPKSGMVEVKVFDMLGREIMTLVNEQKNAGKYSVTFDASKLSSGMYLYSIKANDFTATKKMIFMK